MKNNIVKSKSFSFALEIIKIYSYLVENKKEYVMSKQLLRSGTSIGALIRESEYAESKADFVHKMAIALKESNESLYWIELLYQSQYIEKSIFDHVASKSEEIIKLLTAIINTAKQNR
jgi:four helix bundle protein